MLICKKCEKTIGIDCQCYGDLKAQSRGMVIDMQNPSPSITEAIAPAERETSQEPLGSSEEAEPVPTAVISALERLTVSRTMSPPIPRESLPTRHLCLGCGEYLATLVSMEEVYRWVALCQPCFKDLKGRAERAPRVPAISDDMLRQLAAPSTSQPAIEPDPVAPDDSNGIGIDDDLMKLAQAAGISREKLEMLAAMSVDDLQRLAKGGR